MKILLFCFVFLAASLAGASDFRPEAVDQMREVMRLRRERALEENLHNKVQVRLAEVALMKILGEKREFSSQELLMEIQKFDQSEENSLQDLAGINEWPLTQAFLELKRAYQNYRAQNYPGSPASHDLVAALRRYNRSVHKKRQTKEETFFWPYIGLGTESGLLRPLNSSTIDFSNERKESEFYWSQLDDRWEYLDFLKSCSHWLL